MEKDSQQTIDRSAKEFFLGTLLSRFAGMLRDNFIAFFFGAAPDIAAFMVAFRFSHIFRRLLGEGTIHTGFVPYFENVRKEDLKKGSYFFRDVFFFLFVVSFIVVLLGEIFLFFLQKPSGDNFSLVIYLTMLMLPGLVFICLYAISSSLLQCQKKFFLPAAAPIIFNVLWIGAIFYAHSFPREKAIFLLAIGIIIAFLGQWLIVFFSSIRALDVKLTFKEWLVPKIFSSDCRRLVKPFSLGIIGVGAMQINSAVDSIFARMADVSGPAYLWYAIRLQQLPLSLFGIALAGAILPPLSRAIQEGNQEQYDSFLTKAIQQAIGLMLPATMAIFALGGVTINLLWGRGEFSLSAIIQTEKALWAYSMGLFPAVCILIFSSGFYAKKNFFIPSIASLISMIANIGLNAFFVFTLHMGSVSIALATSISAFLNAAILGFFLLKDHKSFVREKKNWLSFGKIFACSTGAFLFTFLVEKAALVQEFSLKAREIFPKGILSQIIEFFFLSITFFTCLFLLAYLFRAEDFLRVSDKILSKIFGKVFSRKKSLASQEKS